MKVRLFAVVLGLTALWAVQGCASQPRGDDDDVTGDGDADADGDGDGDGECDDRDGDGAGIGDGCSGDDCDDTDPGTTSDCGTDCGAHPQRLGCPCPTTTAGSACTASRASCSSTSRPAS